MTRAKKLAPTPPRKSWGAGPKSKSAERALQAQKARDALAFEEQEELRSSQATSGSGSGFLPAGTKRQERGQGPSSAAAALSDSPYNDAPASSTSPDSSVVRCGKGPRNELSCELPWNHEGPHRGEDAAGVPWTSHFSELRGEERKPTPAEVERDYRARRGELEPWENPAFAGQRFEGFEGFVVKGGMAQGVGLRHEVGYAAYDQSLDPRSYRCWKRMSESLACVLEIGHDGYCSADDEGRPPALGRAVRSIWPHVRPVTGSVVVVAEDAEVHSILQRELALLWPECLVKTVRPCLVLGAPAPDLEAVVRYLAMADAAVLLLPLYFLTGEEERTWLRDHPPAIYPLPHALGFQARAWFVWGGLSKPRTLHHLEVRP